MFSKVDADRILKRVAEIEGSDDGHPLSADELRSIAGEAGFGSRAVERALAEAERARAVQHHPVDRMGIVVARLSTVRTVPIETTSEQLLRAVRLFRHYREGEAAVSIGDHQLSWRDRKGLRFSVASAGGVTEIQVRVSKVLLRRGRWMGWVKSAADRLESIIFMVATQDMPINGLGRSGWTGRTRRKLGGPVSDWRSGAAAFYDLSPGHPDDLEFYAAYLNGTEASVLELGMRHRPDNPALG